MNRDDLTVLDDLTREVTNLTFDLAEARKERDEYKEGVEHFLRYLQARPIEDGCVAHRDWVADAQMLDAENERLRALLRDVDGYCTGAGLDWGGSGLGARIAAALEGCNG